MQTQQRIAVIDDDKDFRELFSNGLKMLGYDVKSITPNSNYLTQLQHFAPHIITLDLNLSSTQTGIDLLIEIRSKLLYAKIVIITGFASITSTVECIKKGADNVFVKPITPTQFISQLKEEDHRLNKVKSDLNSAEWELITQTLQQNQFNITQTAKFLGISRRTLQRKLQKRPYFF